MNRCRCLSVQWGCQVLFETFRNWSSLAVAFYACVYFHDCDARHCHISLPITSCKLSLPPCREKCYRNPFINYDKHWCTTATPQLLHYFIVQDIYVGEPFPESKSQNQTQNVWDKSINFSIIYLLFDKDVVIDTFFTAHKMKMDKFRPIRCYQ